MPLPSRCPRRMSPSVDTLALAARARRAAAIDLAHLARPLRRSDDAILFHDVDEPARAREADGHLPLQHRDRGLAGACDDIHGFLAAVVVDLIAIALTPRETVGALDDLLVAVVADARLERPVMADRLDLVVRYEHALRAD